MKTKHMMMNKLVAAAGVVGALTINAGTVSAANPDIVPVWAVGQGVGLSENPGNGDRVGFTVHSYVAYAALDVTGVTDGAWFTGVQFTSSATAICAPGANGFATDTGTNIFDGDLWYVGCVGVYNGIEGRVTVH